MVKSLLFLLTVLFLLAALVWVDRPRAARASGANAPPQMAARVVHERLP